MTYKDEDKKRATTRARVQRHRALHKGVTSVTCPDCKGMGFKEHNHGLLQVGCAKCKGTGEI